MKTAIWVMAIIIVVLIISLIITNMPAVRVVDPLEAMCKQRPWLKICKERETFIKDFCRRPENKNHPKCRRTLKYK